MKQYLPVRIIVLIGLVFGLSTLTLPVAQSGEELLVFRQSWGSEGGRFRFPYDVAGAPDGTIYVTDKGYGRVTIITKERNILVLGSEGQFVSPDGVAVDRAGNVFVTDDNDRVQKFAPDGSFLMQWGTTGSGPGQFDGPIRIDVDNDGNVYVLDRNNERVQKFTNSGIYLSQWNAADSSGGVLLDSSGIGVDGSNHVYVSTRNGRVVKFDAEGNTLLEWTAINYSDEGTTDIAADGDNNIRTFACCHRSPD